MEEAFAPRNNTFNCGKIPEKKNVQLLSKISKSLNVKCSLENYFL
jgi:hypothetical protein